MNRKKDKLENEDEGIDLDDLSLDDLDNLSLDELEDIDDIGEIDFDFEFDDEDNIKDEFEETIQQKHTEKEKKGSTPMSTVGLFIIIVVIFILFIMSLPFLWWLWLLILGFILYIKGRK